MSCVSGRPRETRFWGSSGPDQAILSEPESLKSLPVVGGHDRG